MARILSAVAVVVSMACGTPAVQPPPECQAYFDCFSKTGGVGIPAEPEFGAGGACWTGTTAKRDRCVADCQGAHAALKASYPSAGCQ